MKCHTKYSASIWLEKSTKIGLSFAAFCFGLAMIWTGKAQGDAIQNILLLVGGIGAVTGIMKKPDEQKDE